MIFGSFQGYKIFGSRKVAEKIENYPQDSALDLESCIPSTPSRVLKYPTYSISIISSSLHIFSLFSMLGVVKTLDGVDVGGQSP